MKKRNILLGLALAFCFTACYDLDKMPEGVLSTAEPFRSTGEIRNYIIGVGFGILFYGLL